MRQRKRRFESAQSCTTNMNLLASERGSIRASSGNCIGVDRRSAARQAAFKGLIIPLKVKTLVLQAPHMLPLFDDKIGIETALGRAPRRRGSARHEARGTRIILTEKFFDFLCKKTRKKHFFADEKKEWKKREKTRQSLKENKRWRDLRGNKSSNDPRYKSRSCPKRTSQAHGKHLCLKFWANWRIP